MASVVWRSWKWLDWKYVYIPIQSSMNNTHEMYWNVTLIVLLMNNIGILMLQMNMFFISYLQWTCSSHCNDRCFHLFIFLHPSCSKGWPSRNTGSSVNNVPRWTFPLYLLVWIYPYCTIWINKSPSFFQLYIIYIKIYTQHIHSRTINPGWTT